MSLRNDFITRIQTVSSDENPRTVAVSTYETNPNPFTKPKKRPLSKNFMRTVLGDASYGRNVVAIGVSRRQRVNKPDVTNAYSLGGTLDGVDPDYLPNVPNDFNQHGTSISSSELTDAQINLLADPDPVIGVVPTEAAVIYDLNRGKTTSREDDGTLIEENDDDPTGNVYALAETVGMMAVSLAPFGVGDVVDIGLSIQSGIESSMQKIEKYKKRDTTFDTVYKDGYTRIPSTADYIAGALSMPNLLSPSTVDEFKRLGDKLGYLYMYETDIQTHNLLNYVCHTMPLWRVNSTLSNSNQAFGKMLEDKKELHGNDTYTNDKILIGDSPEYIKLPHITQLEKVRSDFHKLIEYFKTKGITPEQHLRISNLELVRINNVTTSTKKRGDDVYYQEPLYGNANLAMVSLVHTFMSLPELNTFIDSNSLIISDTDSRITSPTNVIENVIRTDLLAKEYPLQTIFGVGGTTVIDTQVTERYLLELKKSLLKDSQINHMYLSIISSVSASGEVNTSLADVLKLSLGSIIYFSLFLIEKILTDDDALEGYTELLYMSKNAAKVYLNAKGQIHTEIPYRFDYKSVISNDCTILRNNGTTISDSDVPYHNQEKVQRIANINNNVMKYINQIEKYVDDRNTFLTGITFISDKTYNPFFYHPNDTYKYINETRTAISETSPLRQYPPSIMTFAEQVQKYYISTYGNSPENSRLVINMIMPRCDSRNNPYLQHIVGTYQSTLNSSTTYLAKYIHTSPAVQMEFKDTNDKYTQSDVNERVLSLRQEAIQRNTEIVNILGLPAVQLENPSTISYDTLVTNNNNTIRTILNGYVIDGTISGHDADVITGSSPFSRTFIRSVLNKYIITVSDEEILTNTPINRNEINQYVDEYVTTRGTDTELSKITAPFAAGDLKPSYTYKNIPLKAGVNQEIPNSSDYKRFSDGFFFPRLDQLQLINRVWLGFSDYYPYTDIGELTDPSSVSVDYRHRLCYTIDSATQPNPLSLYGIDKSPLSFFSTREFVTDYDMLDIIKTPGKAMFGLQMPSYKTQHTNWIQQSASRYGILPLLKLTPEGDTNTYFVRVPNRFISIDSNIVSNVLPQKQTHTELIKYINTLNNPTKSLQTLHILMYLTTVMNASSSYKDYSNIHRTYYEKPLMKDGELRSSIYSVTLNDLQNGIFGANILSTYYDISKDVSISDISNVINVNRPSLWPTSESTTNCTPPTKISVFNKSDIQNIFLDASMRTNDEDHTYLFVPLLLNNNYKTPKTTFFNINEITSHTFDPLDTSYGKYIPSNSNKATDILASYDWADTVAYRAQRPFCSIPIDFDFRDSYLSVSEYSLHTLALDTEGVSIILLAEEEPLVTNGGVHFYLNTPDEGSVFKAYGNNTYRIYNRKDTFEVYLTVNSGFPSLSYSDRQTDISNILYFKYDKTANQSQMYELPNEYTSRYNYKWYVKGCINNDKGAGIIVKFYPNDTTIVNPSHAILHYRNTYSIGDAYLVDYLNRLRIDENEGVYMNANMKQYIQKYIQYVTADTLIGLTGTDTYIIRQNELQLSGEHSAENLINEIAIPNTFPSGKFPNKTHFMVMNYTLYDDDTGMIPIYTYPIPPSFNGYSSYFITRNNDNSITVRVINKKNSNMNVPYRIQLNGALNELSDNIVGESLTIETTVDLQNIPDIVTSTIKKVYTNDFFTIYSYENNQEFTNVNQFIQKLGGKNILGITPGIFSSDLQMNASIAGTQQSITFDPQDLNPPIPDIIYIDPSYRTLGDISEVEYYNESIGSVKRIKCSIENGVHLTRQFDLDTHVYTRFGNISGGESDLSRTEYVYHITTTKYEYSSRDRDYDNGLETRFYDGTILRKFNIDSLVDDGYSKFSGGGTSYDSIPMYKLTFTDTDWSLLKVPYKLYTYYFAYSSEYDVMLDSIPIVNTKNVDNSGNPVTEYIQLRKITNISGENRYALEFRNRIYETDSIIPYTDKIGIYIYYVSESYCGLVMIFPSYYSENNTGINSNIPILDEYIEANDLKFAIGTRSRNEDPYFIDADTMRTNYDIVKYYGLRTKSLFDDNSSIVNEYRTLELGTDGRWITSGIGVEYPSYDVLSFYDSLYDRYTHTLSDSYITSIQYMHNTLFSYNDLLTIDGYRSVIYNSLGSVFAPSSDADLVTLSSYWEKNTDNQDRIIDINFRQYFTFNNDKTVTIKNNTDEIVDITFTYDFKTNNASYYFNYGEENTYNTVSNTTVLGDVTYASRINEDKDTINTTYQIYYGSQKPVNLVDWYNTACKNDRSIHNVILAGLQKVNVDSGFASIKYD